MNGYTTEPTPTRVTCGGDLLYIKNSMNYTIRGDLKI